MNNKKIVIITYAVVLVGVVLALTYFCMSNYNMIQENNNLSNQLIECQKELAIAQDERFVAEESFRIEADRHMATQRDLDEVMGYIDILVDESIKLIMKLQMQKLSILPRLYGVRHVVVIHLNSLL